MIRFKLFLTIAIIMLFNVFLKGQENWHLVGLKDFYSIEHVYAKGDTIWVSAIDSTYKSEVYYSFTAGDTWHKVSDTDTLIGGWLKLIKVNPYNALTVYARTENGRGLKSIDGGRSWKFIFSDYEPWHWDTKLMDIHVSPSNKDMLIGVIQGNEGILRRSWDGGDNWEDIGNFPSSSHGSSLVFTFNPNNSKKMYVIVHIETLDEWEFYSSNSQGDQWALISKLPGQGLQTIPLSSNPDTIFAFPYPMMSNNNGIDWNRTLKEIIIPDSLYQPIITSSYLNFNDYSDIYASIVKSSFYAYETVGIYKRISGDDNWIILTGSEKLQLQSTFNPYSLFIDANTNILYVGTKSGLYSYSLVTSIKENSMAPKEYILYQNYPNPFNPTTKINYQLAQNSFVTLKIYDVAGRIIKTLINQHQNSGEHSITFDGAGLPSGVYFYRVTTSSGFSQSRKMLLVK